MFRRTKKPLAVGLLSLLALGFALPEDAEARRFRRVVRRTVVAPVVVAPVARRRVVYAAPVVRVRAPLVGVGVGYGAVGIRAPGVGVFVGF